MNYYLCIFEKCKERQIIFGLCILYGHFIKSERVNLRSQQFVVVLVSLEILISVQLVRVAAAEVNSLKIMFTINLTIYLSV